MLVAPALYCLADEPALELEDYVRGGGHLVMTFRTGYADEEARARAEVAPGPLRALAGVRYLEYSTLLEPVPLHGLGKRDVARHWADGLELEGAEPLARYDHHHFGRWPAITRHRVGAGTVTYVGTLPGRELTAELFRRQRPAGLVTAESPQVTLHSAVNARGERLWFAHNWSDRESTVTLTARATEVTGRRQPLPPGPLRLAPFDVRVVK
ncbi:hypothetical protein GCM10020220_041730 [Nonomuraea rubra]